jgi:hypothetical protein
MAPGYSDQRNLERPRGAIYLVFSYFRKLPEYSEGAKQQGFIGKHHVDLIILRVSRRRSMVCIIRMKWRSIVLPC